MIVYVESNFVLELAFLQEEHHSASMILEHAVSRRIHLRMLAYCGGEPYERMVRRAKDRKTLQDRLAQEIRELSRSQPYVDIGDLSRALTVILAKSADEEKDRLDVLVENYCGRRNHCARWCDSSEFCQFADFSWTLSPGRHSIRLSQCGSRSVSGD